MAVVVGFIPTEVGFKALAAAREEAEQRGGPLVVVNVLRAGVEEDPRHADEQQLEIARDELRRTTVRVAFRQETTEDDIADVLLQVVEEERAELLVLGVRRQNDLARHLLGLTVQKLLLSSPSDVAVVARSRLGPPTSRAGARSAWPRLPAVDTDPHATTAARPLLPQKGPGRRAVRDRSGGRAGLRHSETGSAPGICSC